MLREEAEHAFQTMMDEVRRGQEVVPHFRVFTPQGDYMLLVQLLGLLDQDRPRMELIHAFMAWKKAQSFLFCSELGGEEVSVVLVTRDECAWGLRLIDRSNKNAITFSEVHWLPGEVIEEETRNLLPVTDTEVDAETIAEIQGAAFPLGVYSYFYNKRKGHVGA